MKKKIIAIDDEPLIAVLMKEIIEEDSELEVAQIATEKNEFVYFVENGSFDAGIVDISVGGREGGLELLQIIKDKALQIPLIMLSAHDELLYAPKCLQAGARGYINKKHICTDIGPCLKQVFDGHYFVSGDKGDFIVKEYLKFSNPVGIQSL